MFQTPDGLYNLCVPGTWSGTTAKCLVRGYAGQGNGTGFVGGVSLTAGRWRDDGNGIIGAVGTDRKMTRKASGTDAGQLVTGVYSGAADQRWIPDFLSP